MSLELTNASLLNLRNHILDARNFDGFEFNEQRFTQAVAKRLGANNFENISEYIDLLEVKPSEYDELFTELFQDQQSRMEISPWITDVIDRMSTSVAQTHELIRIWDVGCQTGELACLFAMLLCDRLGLTAFQRQVKIFATETDDEQLAAARHATFLAAQMEHLPSGLLDKYFTQHETGYTFRADLRRLLIFGKHDVVQDPPISKMDLIVCRYILPFLNPEKQERALSRIRFALKEGKYAVFGEGCHVPESFGLSKLQGMGGIFRKGESASPAPIYADASRRGIVDPSNQINDAAFDHSPAAHIVVDNAGLLAIANARARAAFGIVAIDFGKPLQDLEISYRPVELRSLIEQAQPDGRTAILKGVARRVLDGNAQFFDIYVRKLTDGVAVLGTSIQYLDTTEFQHLKDELISLNHQVQTANEELQSAHEELETTNEELQSTNEELETTNEELQSTNEELQTMNEELHSANAELATTNVSQRQLTDEMGDTNKFLESILASMYAAVIVTGTTFEVLVWNRKATDMFGLRAEEVVGQNLFSLDIGLPVEQLKVPLKDFVKSKKQKASLVLQAVNRRGRSITCRVRISALVRAAEGIVLVIDESGESTGGGGNE